MFNKDKLIKHLKSIGVVRNENVKLKHAGKANFYIDIKKAYGYPKTLNLLTRLVQNTMDQSATCVATGGYGGLPLASALATKYGFKLVLVREKPKTHGRNVWIDGYVPTAEDQIWLVDDVFTTGNSLKQMVKTLKPLKATILGSSVIVKRTDRKMSILCKHLIKANDLL